MAAVSAHPTSPPPPLAGPAAAPTPLDALAARLGRPPKSLAILSTLSDDEVVTLTGLVDAAAESERQRILAAEGSPRLVRPLFRLILQALRR